jgi:predicted alternative tryptophan synthase beta-subunit
VHKNNFRRQRRLESRLGETVRIASIVQKGMTTGRSSYVEMRSLDRLTNHNIKTKVHALKKSTKLNAELEDLFTKIPQAVSEGYAKVLTPNGIVRENELDRLLSIDADIVMCLGMIDPEKSQKIRDAVETLKELLEERKKLVDSLKA